ncbi:MAG: leukotriene-A4 hydrolase [Flavobacteriales bacterium]|jgi:leukotriene-A4 hydrolase
MKKIIGLLVIALISTIGVTGQNNKPSIKNNASIQESPIASFWKNSEVIDQHSYARPREIMITHADLDLELDFRNKVITGSVTYQLKINSGREIILDTKGLKIEKVISSRGDSLEFKVGEENPLLGAPLSIILGPKGDTEICIFYSTSKDAESLQWLTKEQASSDHPFLYTQGEAILTRSWIPIQDSPGIKITYSARVNVPKELTCVMSANRTVDNDTVVFEMTNPIPAYLIAMAVGDLKFTEISETCGVWGLPDVVEKAASEFKSAPEMIIAAERIAGPYLWERYDMIVLPKAFPFGGMENPMLTFLTPTVIAGDGSLVSLVAHELAHSWSGNLVTNATWDDFWLNEGVTVYLERRIVEEVYGRELFLMHRYNGYLDLKSTIEELGEDNPDTHLKLDLSGRNPDDGMTDVAYEKGAFFLEHLAMREGNEKMDKFLRQYFQQDRKFNAVTTKDFLELLRREYEGSKILTEEFINKWVYGPGLPETWVAKPDKFKLIDTIIVKLNAENALVLADLESFSVPEWLYFLQSIKSGQISKASKDVLLTFKNKLYSNSEIQAKWFVLSLEAGYDSENQAIHDFLNTVGRRKFLVPIYKAIIEHSDDIPYEKKNYLKRRGNYHSITQNTLDQLFKVSSSDVSGRPQK